MTRSRPLPGIRFEAVAPPLGDALPRMDIPVFAGFAASGPLHTPLAVEDVSQFANVFGGDVELPRPRNVRDPRIAHLGPTVRAFFRNGGRRCWIIRVADSQAEWTRFPMPNLMKVLPDDTLVPAFVVARSEGSWADALRVQTNLRSRPVRVLTLTLGANPSMEVAVSSANEIAVGDLVRVSWPDANLALHLFVDEVIDASSPPPSTVRTVSLRGKALWLRRILPSPPEAEPVYAVETSPAPSGRMVSEQITFDLTVRSSEDRPLRLSGLGFAPAHTRYFGALPADVALFASKPEAQWELLWSEVSSPRFPIAALFDGGRYLPVGMDVLLSDEQPAAVHDEPRAFVRNGLSQFSRDMFLDANLGHSDVRDLLDRANALRDLQNATLTGIHAAIGIEEATMLAAPDAVHRGWRLAADPVAELGSPPASPLPPVAARPTFFDCDTGLSVSSPPSTSIGGPAGAAENWTAFDENEDDDPTLVDVHKAMVRIAAARADMVAMLSLPRHYDHRRAIAHTSLLEDLGAQARSYAALSHPWVVMRDDDAGPLRTFPPDGPMTGVMAARANLRGAWVAPANEPLRGVVALTPAIRADARQSLQDAGVNIIRHEPSGFVCLDADTLTIDDDYRALNVRRLLILLRRVAIRTGNDYAFEPNSLSLRNTIKRGFEAMLSSLFARGAFAGRNTKSAFQVVTDETVNTPAGVDAGRLVAEIRVAPSRPLSFLTIRLLQRGEAAVVQEVR